MGKWLKNIGPGPLVAAAFIGPGTVTVCTLAGVRFGYALLWALLFSIFATIILQEMAARLGIITQKGLADVIREEIKSSVLRYFFIGLILAAIVIGNAAYEAGNISGGILGLETILGEQILDLGGLNINVFSFIIGLIAAALLFWGNYKIIERTLITLVILMSLSFLTTAIATQPNWKALFSGLFTFQSPEGSLLTIVGLIGTTVVPYNLFLHASLAREKWRSKDDLKPAQKDTIIAILLGGIVSMAIVVSATAINSDEITNAADLALSLAPLFGDFAKYFLSIGLFAAGITSAITAPLAAAYVAAGCLGWNTNLKSFRFRLVWVIILILGIIFSSLGIKSISIIEFAQFANGLLLPLIAGFLIWAMNRKRLLGRYKNSRIQNGIAILILLVAIGLGLKSIIAVFKLL